MRLGVLGVDAERDWFMLCVGVRKKWVWERGSQIDTSVGIKLVYHS